MDRTGRSVKFGSVGWVAVLRNPTFPRPLSVGTSYVQLSSSAFSVQSSEKEPTLSVETFDEAEYLKTSPDVATVVHDGKLDSGWHHYQKHG
jgi:hypothetical protein